MSKFKDNSGREWTIDIDVDAVEQVHNVTEISIPKLLDEKCKPLAELLDNMPAMAHVCYVLVGAEAAGTDRKTFARGIKGDPFGSMVKAFLEELTLFFPDPRRRAAVEKLMQTWLSFETKALDQLTTEMEGINPETVAQDALTKMLSTASGSSPA
jgi:hypothetical protein